MNNIDPWVTLSIVLMAILLVIVFRQWRSQHSYCRAPARDAYRRGLEYALVELHAAEDDEACVERLVAEAENGKGMDPSPFDDAILDVVREHTNRRDLQARALIRAVERLQGMEHMGEASSSEVGVALDVLQELLGGSPAEPSVFITEYLHLEGGEARLVRRPLRDWPSWADDLNPIHTHGVPAHD